MSAPDDREREREHAREGGENRAADDAAKPAAGSEWVPAFEGQRPPFEKGNTRGMTHGAHVPRKVEEIARRVSDELLERFPVVAEYPETLTALARSESVTRLLFGDIVQKGIYDAKGDFRASIISRYFTAENSSAKLRASLGMTPQSEAQVARDRAAATASAVDVVGELIRQGQATRSEQPALPSAHDHDGGAAAREEHGHG